MQFILNVLTGLLLIEVWKQDPELCQYLMFAFGIGWFFRKASQRR